MRQFATIVALGAIILGIITPTARADDCKLQAIPVDLVPNPAGQMLVALKINQQPSLFVLDTGAGVSVIHRGKTTGMPIYTSARGVSGVSGVVSKDYVVVPTLSIGSVKFHNVQMFVEPDDPDPGTPVFGVLGANILAMLDIEINMSENKLNFFLPSGCGDRVVYWKNDGFSELDFQRNFNNQIVVKMKLDGKKILSLIDTGATYSLLRMSSASDLFDLEAGVPGMEESGQAADIHGDLVTLYRHRFKTLEMEGLRFTNPWITISEAKIGANSLHSPYYYDMLFGVHEMRNVHMYISYHDKKIYITKASINSGDFSARETASAVQPTLTMDGLDWQLLRPYLDRSDAASREGKFDDALAALDELLTHYPNYAIIYYDRAQIDRKRNDDDGALADLGRALSLLPSYVDAYRLRSEIRRDKHDEDGATADMDTAAKYEAASYRALSEQLAQAGDRDGAIADLSHAIELDPKYAQAYVARAEQRSEARDYDGALSDATRAIELEPKFIRAYSTRAQVYLLRKDYEHALADYRQVNQLDPKKAYALQGIGNALHRLGRDDEALASYNQAIDLAPKNARYLNSRCWQLALMARFQEAVDDCDNGIELAPKWSPVIDSRAYVYLKLHQLKRAISDFDRAVEVNPKSAHSLYGRSLAKREMGDANGAEADLTAAIKLQPDIAQHFPE